MRRTAEDVYRLAVAHVKAVDFVYDPDVGYLVWHHTTGNNLEVLYVEVAERRRGHGTELFRRMVKKVILTGMVPYNSVVTWRLTDNVEAMYFYDSLGFHQTDMGKRSVYLDRGATLMVVKWDALVRQLFPDGVK